MNLDGAMAERAGGERGSLDRLRDALAARRGQRRGPYRLPPLWPAAAGGGDLDPAAAYLAVLEGILAAPPAPFTPAADHPAGWTGRARVYNLFVRSGLAWDHDGAGLVDTEPDAEGWRRTGTLVKALALLPYIRSLGCDTVHLLPVAARGKDGCKGTLGSPYAVRDPYRVEETLAEPALGLGGEECLAAFVAAAHRLGVRVVVEFVFRTAAPDSDWALEHPEWFYWVDADLADRPAGSRDPALYGPPIFPAGELDRIRRQVEEERSLVDLPPPPALHRELFRPPPVRVERRGDRLIGLTAAGGELRVATAFADWPPDDCQPPWTDAAYLRIYDDPEFNYVAYNTIRMYDAALARPEKARRDLWERIAGILPAWQERFHIDGVMVDMGHALPAALKEMIQSRARSNRPDFAFWDEKFPIEAASREEGYNAVLGYSWCVTSRREEFRNLLERCSRERLPLPFLATAESHNSPRAAAREGGATHSRGVFPFLCALPAVPWIHCGFETAEVEPVNTGLDFAPHEAARHPARELALFSARGLAWREDAGLVDLVRACLALRAEGEALITDPDPASCRLLPGGGESVMVLWRGIGDNGIALVGNTDWRNCAAFSCHLPATAGEVCCRLTGRCLAPGPEGELSGELAPGEVLWLEVRRSE